MSNFTLNQNGKKIYGKKKVKTMTRVVEKEMLTS